MENPLRIESFAKSEIKTSNEAIKKKIDENYIQKRDPIKEFFVLTCQSVKLSSPHLNLIAHLNTDMLYKKALSEGILYYKFWSWIESTI